MTNYLKIIITNNWPIKLISIAVAFGLWMYISLTGSKVDNYPGGLTLNFKNAPNDIAYFTETQKIEVKFIAQKSLINKINSESLSAYIDLSNVKQGTHELGVQLQNHVEGLEIIDYNPKIVLVNVEPKITKNIPVVVRVEGDAYEGMVPNIPQTSPENVSVTGAKSILDNIYEANAIVKLNGEKEEIQRTIKLVTLNQENQPINNVLVSPQEAEVRVPIVKADTVKTVGIKLVTEGVPKEGYWVSDIKTSTPNITITGKSSALRSINYLETKPIKLDDLDKDIIKDIELNLPTGISLIDSNEKIKISLKLSQIDITKEVTAKLEINNIPSHLNISSIDTLNIKAIISSSKDNIANLKDEDLKLVIDAANLKEGENNINIIQTNFNINPQFKLINWLPSNLKLTLTKK